MITAGIDAGSRAIKIVLYDTRRETALAEAACDQGVDQQARARRLYDRLLADHGLSPGDVRACAATGYGRHKLDFADTAVTEISCHAAGVRRHVPDAATVIDIGGQDSKLIRLDARGRVRDFVMNDRCAAGTGRFLEVVSQRLEIGLDELGPAARRCDAPARISSMCVVFAETEIIGLLADGQSRENIVGGVQQSIAQRLAAMAAGDLAGPVVFTGGVALISGMPEALAERLGHPVTVCPRPRFTGALGAAVLAARHATETSAGEEQ